MRNQFALNLLGSDAEFLFCNIEEWAPHVIPANTIITNNKAVGLKSFIGVDGHPATAEFRPPPTRNIKLHLYYIASGIDALNEYLKSRKKFADVKLIALPWSCNEPLGGHIHVSGFLNEPQTKWALDHNYVYSNGFLQQKNKEIGHSVDNLVPSEGDILRTYVERCASGEYTNPDVFCRILNYLVLPFEFWIQPWDLRKRRAQHYSGSDHGNYFVRWLCSEPPNRRRFENWAYVHIEYRFPSTWLIHPWLAYTYFALVKFITINWNLAREQAYTAKPLTIPSAKAENEIARQTLYNRYQDMLDRGAVLTKDLKDLPKAMELCGRSRDEWFSRSTAGIDIKAWKRLVEGGS